MKAEQDAAILEAPRVNPEDPRVKRTRQLLLDAFGALLVEKGFEALTVQDVTERATVNRATFYAHYKDKYDLAESMVRDDFRERLVTGLPPSAPITAKSLEMLVVAVFEYFARAYGHCNLDRQFGPLLETVMHSALQSFIVDWLRRGRRDTPTNERSLQTAAMVVSSSLLRTGIEWCRSERKRPATDVARDLIAILAPGVIAATRAS
jgi:AcrR family transcriptional regulator